MKLALLIKTLFFCCLAVGTFGDEASSLATKSNVADVHDCPDIDISEEEINAASILLADYIAENRREEALYEAADLPEHLHKGIAEMKAGHREQEEILKKVALHLFDPKSPSNERSLQVILQIYAKERHGTKNILDEEGKIDAKKFREWFTEKLKLADELRLKIFKQKLEKKSSEIIAEFKSDASKIVEELNSELEGKRQQWERETWWQEMAVYFFIVIGLMLWVWVQRNSLF